MGEGGGAYSRRLCRDFPPSVKILLDEEGSRHLLV